MLIALGLSNYINLTGMKVFLCSCLVFVLCISDSLKAQYRYGVPVQVEVPAAPIPFKSQGKFYLVYELHITNFRTNTLTLSKTEIFGEGKAGMSLAHYDGKELSDRITRPGLAPDSADKLVIAGGLRAVLFIWLTFEKVNLIPTSIHHKLTFKAVDSAQALTIEAARVRVNRMKIPVLAPPLGEGMWICARGPSNESGHRRALIPTEGRAYLSQRFAIDFMKVGIDRRVTPDNHGSKNESWYGYGSQVFSVADATVVRILDSLPDNVPFSTDRVVPVTSETVGGNYVVLKLQEGLYAFYGHLKPHSITVKVGQKVRKGQVIGLLGNSGNSDAPHLHFHLATAPSTLGAEGLPFAFNSYTVLGIEAFDPKSKSVGNKRSLELPLENELIRFQ